jgi:galactoside O-acetyltransferase
LALSIYALRKIFFGNQIIIKVFQSISIRDGTSIMARSYLYAQENGLLVIGDRCAFSNNLWISANAGEIEIDDVILIGSNTVLRAADHILSHIDITFIEQGHKKGKITIGNDAWGLML